MFAAGGVEQTQLIPAMPPQLRHLIVVCPDARKVDMLRRCIHALDSQQALVFMNFQQRVKDTIFKLEARSMKVRALLSGKQNPQRQMRFDLPCNVLLARGCLDAVTKCLGLAQYAGFVKIGDSASLRLYQRAWKTFQRLFG